MDKVDTNSILWQCRKRNAIGLPLTLTKYILYSDRLVIRTGMLSIVEKEIDLFKITDKQVKLPLLGRMLNYGTVLCHAKTSFTDVFEVKNVKDVRGFYSLFDRLIDEQRDKYRVKGLSMIGDTCDAEIE